MFQRPRPPIRPASSPAPIRFLDDRPVACRPWWRCKAAQQQQQQQAQVQPVVFLPDPKPVPVPAAPAPAPAPAPRKRREWPIGTMAFLAVVGVGLAGNHYGWQIPGHYRLHDQQVRTFEVANTPIVVVEAARGPIEVTRGVSGRVECTADVLITAPDAEQARESLGRLPLEMKQVGDTVSIDARDVEGARISLRLAVPAGTKLRLKSDEGSIDVEATDGPLVAESGNGTIRVVKATGPVSLTSGNGAIECEGHDLVVVADTTNGAISFEGSLAPGRSSFQARNGAVSLELPDSQQFHLDAKTGNGRIESEFRVQGDVSKARRARHLVGQVGDDPAVAVTIRTGNGRIELEEIDSDD